MRRETDSVTACSAKARGTAITAAATALAVSRVRLDLWVEVVVERGQG